MADVRPAEDVNTGEKSASVKMDMFSDTWGFELEDLYKISLKFYKEKVGGKALELAYKDKLHMVALTKQVSIGQYRDDASPAVGFLDVVGNDRRLAWKNLGTMSREDAMSEFVSYLRKTCPQFAPYVQAHVAERQEQERKRLEKLEEERRERENVEKQKLAEATQLQEVERQRQISQEMMIRDALNKQTAAQFRQYAEQQFPRDTVQQEALIRQLQDQHYVQYMQQCYNQQLLQQQQQMAQQQQLQSQVPLQQPQYQSSPIRPSQMTTSTTSTPSRMVNGGSEQGLPTSTNLPNGIPKSDIVNTTATSEFPDDVDADPNELPPVAAASMWTRKDVKEFKESLKNDQESVLKVGSGEIVTVRVPTHEDGSCLFWEFATDHYDIGFGLYFEWTVDTTNQVSVHVGESSEDDDDDAVRKGKSSDPSSDDKPAEDEVPTEEIVPPFRRDCQSEVYCGSHVYPGRGVYLLKFDNSYSLWRSKTLYYRVYYTR